MAAVSMIGSSDVERLSDCHYVVLILRLLVDKHGQIVHGEVGGAAGERDERWVRFRGADGLLGAIWTRLSSGEEAE